MHQVSVSCVSHLVIGFYPYFFFIFETNDKETVHNNTSAFLWQIFILNLGFTHGTEIQMVCFGKYKIGVTF